MKARSISLPGSRGHAAEKDGDQEGTPDLQGPGFGITEDENLHVHPFGWLNMQACVCAGGERRGQKKKLVLVSTMKSILKDDLSK